MREIDSGELKRYLALSNVTSKDGFESTVLVANTEMWYRAFTGAADAILCLRSFAHCDEAFENDLAPSRAELPILRRPVKVLRHARIGNRRVSIRTLWTTV